MFSVGLICNSLGQKVFRSSIFSADMKRQMRLLMILTCAAAGEIA